MDQQNQSDNTPYYGKVLENIDRYSDRESFHMIQLKKNKKKRSTSKKKKDQTSTELASSTSVKDTNKGIERELMIRNITNGSNVNSFAIIPSNISNPLDNQNRGNQLSASQESINFQNPMVTLHNENQKSKADSSEIAVAQKESVYVKNNSHLMLNDENLYSQISTRQFMYIDTLGSYKNLEKYFTSFYIFMLLLFWGYCLFTKYFRKKRKNEMLINSKKKKRTFIKKTSFNHILQKKNQEQDLELLIINHESIL